MNNSCQDVINTLMRAIHYHDNMVFVRELASLTEEQKITCNNLQLNMILDKYVQYIGKESIERIKNFDESLKDRNKSDHAHAILKDDVIESLCKHRTWESWWNQ